MTTEEKAKAYDKALERAQKAADSGMVSQNFVDDIFQLNESEDEKIRKVLIHIVQGACDKYGIKYRGEISEEKLLAYLEKQKEQKPAECIEDSVKFEEGFKAGRESGLCDGQKYVLNNLDSYGLCKPAEWSEDIIQKAVKEVGLTQYQIDWFKTNVFLPKQEWSEEDEKMMETFLHKLEVCDLLTNKEIRWVKHRLKSLRPQPQWKPSEDDFESLSRLKGSMPDNEWGNQTEGFIEDLIDNLKKL